MEIEIEVISKEIIKPSSPTPESLRKHQLSFLDQIAPPAFMPVLYFYQADAKFSNLKKSNNLKKSLSQVLSRFYPLAGRLVDDLYVDCNDEGAPYVEAVANCTLSQIITNPVMKNMDKFLPYKVDEYVQNLCMAVQVTYFQCGGTAVGLVISHKIADGSSFVPVANTWAAVARNGNYDDVPAPKFEGAKIFPPQDATGFKPPSSTGIVKEAVITKIFTFPASKISALQERYSSGAAEFLQRPPSRVEALSAFIWTRFVSATEMKANPNKIYTVRHTVNLRPRLNPPLSDYHFGNIFWVAVAMPSVGANCGVEVMQKVKEAIRAVNGENVAQLLQGGETLNFLKEKMAYANRGELVRFTFTSLHKFPLYKADFGWGKPVWVVTLAGLLDKNLVVLVDTATGDGIEARINLSKEDMEKFEADLELQEFLSKSKTFGIHNSRL